jgi:ABC-2 type transport system ATP-binding protein
MATVCGYDVVREASKVRSSIGLAASSERSFYFRLTGCQNLEFFGGLLGLRGRELKHRIEYLLDLVGLSDARNLSFMKYSSGMKRKLSLARCLLNDPPVYLLDEPTAGIDPGSAIHIRGIIEELKARGKTILLTTHNMEVADKLSDLIGILKEGRLIEVDTPANLRGILWNKRMVITLDPQVLSACSKEKLNDLAHTLRRIPAVSSISMGNPDLVLQLNDTTSITAIVRTLSDSGLEIKCIKTEEPTLENVFIRLTEQ